jgi:hypothetical protein
MSVRLSRPPDGDPLPCDFRLETTETTKDNGIPPKDDLPLTPLEKPSATDPPNFLPIEFRHRIHRIIAQSQNPSKSIIVLRKKFENLLSTERKYAESIPSPPRIPLPMDPAPTSATAVYVPASTPPSALLDSSLPGAPVPKFLMCLNGVPPKTGSPARACRRVDCVELEMPTIMGGISGGDFA